MSHSVISLGLGLGGGKSATSSGGGGGGAPFTNESSVALDGTDDSCHVPANASLNTAGNVSFSAWVYSDSISSVGYGGIGAKRDAGGFDWQFAVTGAKLTLYMTGGVTVNGSTTLSNSTWYHVAFTVDVGVTDGVKFYVNGDPEDYTGTSAASAPNGTNVGFNLGWNDVASRYWNCKIDELAFFHSALSASDISDIFNGGNGPASLAAYSPVGWWRMGACTEAESGTTIYDMSNIEFMPTTRPSSTAQHTHPVFRHNEIRNSRR